MIETAAACLRVLMIEDNPGDARLIREATGRDGAVQLTHKHSLSAGLDAIAELPFDAVLLDLALPDSHGLESVRRVRAASPHLPIVVMTSLDDERTALDAVAEGAQDYLVKGLDSEPRTLTRALRYAIERQRWQEQLADARKLDAMGRLAAAAAHEYNTLLGTILGCSDLMLDSLADHSKVRELNADIQTAVRRAAAVTEQILEVGGRKAIRSCGLSLNAAIRGTERDLQRLVGPRRRLSMSFDAAFDAVMFDPCELQHVLTTLVRSMLQLSPRSDFELETRNIWADDTTARRMGLVPGLLVALKIVVAGPGLAPEMVAGLLEPLPRPKEGDPSLTGLSLAGVNGTLRAHGVRLVVDSIGAGRGTAITLYFLHRSQHS